jgi:hypothetical protein
MDDLLARFRDAGFWRRLNPQLGVEERAPPSPVVAPAPRVVDGRFVLDGIVPEAAALRAGLARLAAAGVPTPFLFVYDEAWALVARAATLLEPFLGGPVVLGPRAWASPAGAGAPPASRPPPWLRAAAAPSSATVWAPLAGGDVEGWFHDVLRWGGRAATPLPSSLGGIAFDVERGDAGAWRAPSLGDRLALVGGKILAARHALVVPERLARLAGALK